MKKFERKIIKNKLNANSVLAKIKRDNIIIGAKILQARDKLKNSWNQTPMFPLIMYYWLLNLNNNKSSPHQNFQTTQTSVEVRRTILQKIHIWRMFKFLTQKTPGNSVKKYLRLPKYFQFNQLSYPPLHQQRVPSLIPP